MATASNGIRDWIQILVSALPGLAAVIALVFAALSVQANNVQLKETRQQLDISQQGQITDRFNAATANLASSNSVIQLGGIFALQRIMQDSPRDQPSVVELLSAYIREHAPLSTVKKAVAVPNPSHMITQSTTITLGSGNVGIYPSSDIQAALNALVKRNAARDGPAEVDLHDSDLTGAYLVGANFRSANLDDVILDGANLNSANLRGATLQGSRLKEADLERANLSATKLTPIKGVPKGYAAYVPTDSTQLVDADLSGSDFSDANLTGATLENVNLSGADLSCSNFLGSQLSRVDLARAIVAGANFSAILARKTDFKAANHKDTGNGTCASSRAPVK